jgi:hypothetical protein
MKDPAGDPSDRKNYRPITLLTEYGKIFERFIRRRFFATTVDFHSRTQYGFISGRSAVSALLKYKETIEETTDKYAATRYLLATLKSYLTDRTVTYRDGSVEVSKACTKGCPQGCPGARPLELGAGHVPRLGTVAQYRNHRIRR